MSFWRVLKIEEESPPILLLDQTHVSSMLAPQDSPRFDRPVNHLRHLSPHACRSTDSNTNPIGVWRGSYFCFEYR